MKLNAILKKHYKKHTFNSSTSLSVTGETSMATIADLKKEIQKVVNALRNELAFKKFNLPYNELTQKQQEVIKKHTQKA